MMVTVCRLLINSKQAYLQDGDQVIILLKDRSKTPSEDERDWYERAFGKKRNMMNFTVRYVPLFDAGRRGLCDFFVKLHYKMFPEQADEFEPREYDKYRDILLKMTGEEDDNDNWIYKYQLELPYGELKYTFHFSNKSSNTDDKQDLPASQLEYLKARLEPEPISHEQQKIAD